MLIFCTSTFRNTCNTALFVVRYYKRVTKKFTVHFFRASTFSACRPNRTLLLNWPLLHWYFKFRSRFEFVQQMTGIHKNSIISVHRLRWTIHSDNNTSSIIKNNYIAKLPYSRYINLFFFIFVILLLKFLRIQYYLLNSFEYSITLQIPTDITLFLKIIFSINIVHTPRYYC